MQSSLLVQFGDSMVLEVNGITFFRFFVAAGDDSKQGCQKLYL
jgi:hypothetical protein